jgi:hypothetical protein
MCSIYENIDDGTFIGRKQSLMQRPNHLRPKMILIQMGKVNLNLNLLVIEILNALSV